MPYRNMKCTPKAGKKLLGCASQVRDFSVSCFIAPLFSELLVAVLCVAAEFLLDAYQLVVLSHTVRAAH